MPSTHARQYATAKASCPGKAKTLEREKESEQAESQTDSGAAQHADTDHHASGSSLGVEPEETVLGVEPEETVQPSHEVAALHSKFDQDPNFKGIRAQFGADELFTMGVDAVIGPMDVQVCCCQSPRDSCD